MVVDRKTQLFFRYILDDSDDIIGKYNRSTRIMLYRLAADEKDPGEYTRYVWKNDITTSGEMNAVSEIMKAFGIDGSMIKSLAATDSGLTETLKKLADAIERIPAAEYHEDIYIPTFGHLIWYELYSLLRNDIHFRKCMECGRYFPVTEENNLYCDIRDKDGTSCYTRHLEEERNSEMQKIYRKHYHRHLMRVKNCLEEKEVFQRWNREAVAARNAANEKHLLPVEYEQIISKDERKK